MARIARLWNILHLYLLTKELPISVNLSYLKHSAYHAHAHCPLPFCVTMSGTFNSL